MYVPFSVITPVIALVFPASQRRSCASYSGDCGSTVPSDWRGRSSWDFGFAASPSGDKGAASAVSFLSSGKFGISLFHSSIGFDGSHWRVYWCTSRHGWRNSSPNLLILHHMDFWRRQAIISPGILEWRSQSIEEFFILSKLLPL